MSSDDRSQDFLAGGGEMGALTRAYDWSSTSLGPPETWPQSLRVTMRIVLNTNHPMFIWWGPDLIQFYNDAYRETMGPERHPSALGAKGRECWAEIWDIIGPQINYVMAGKGSTWDEDRLIPVTRYGRREDVWWTYSYGPIDVGGKVGGVLVICNDVTAQHLATESLQDQTIRLQGLFEQAPTFSAVLSGPEHRFELANAAYKRLVGHRDIIGKTVREAFPEVEEQGFTALLDGVFRSNTAYVGRRLPLTFEGDGEPRTAFVDFVYQPITDAGGEVSGIFVVGTDVTDSVESENRLRLLNEELKHRVKNTLAVVSAIATQTLRGKDAEAELNNFNARLAAFGRAHDILTADNFTTAAIGEVVNQALAHHRTDGQRFHVSGPPVELGSQQALSLSLALHELATNAAKYGALSDRSGSVDITWSIDADREEPEFRFVWQEKNGPIVVAPTRTGFGSQLIKAVLAADFHGKVELSFERDGLVCRLRAPLAKCCPPSQAPEA